MSCAGRAKQLYFAPMHRMTQVKLVSPRTGRPLAGLLLRP